MKDNQIYKQIGGVHIKIARKTIWSLVLVAMLIVGGALSEAASYNYGYSTFNTGTGSNGYWYSSGSSNTSWTGIWGWYRPWPSTSTGSGSNAGSGSNTGSGSGTGTTQPGNSGGSTGPVVTPGNGSGTDTQPPTSGLSAEESDAIAKVNASRTANGLKPLTVNMELVRLARMKAKDMAEKGYFDHISPTYGSPFDMLQAAGMAYQWAGENIARASSVSVAHDAFMQSAGHRANILNSAYTQIGIGIYRKGNTMWESQFFMKPR